MLLCFSHPSSFFIIQSPDRDFCCECQLTRERLSCLSFDDQLSIAQLGGGIGVGAHARQYKYYTLLNTPEMLLLEGLATGVSNSISSRRLDSYSRSFSFGTLEVYFVISSLLST